MTVLISRKSAGNINDVSKEEHITIDFVLFFKYLYSKWKWLVVLHGISFMCGFLFIQLTIRIYETEVILLPSAIGTENTSPSLGLSGFSVPFLKSRVESANDQLIPTILNSHQFLASMHHIEIATKDQGKVSISQALGFKSINNKNIYAFTNKLKKTFSFEKGLAVEGYHNLEYVLKVKGEDPVFVYNFAQFLIPYFDSTWISFITGKIEKDIESVKHNLGFAAKTLKKSEKALVSFQEKNVGVGSSYSSPQLNQKLRELLRTVKIEENNYTMLYSKLESLKLKKLSLSPKLTILDVAYLPRNHSYPQNKKVHLISFGLGFVLFSTLFFIVFLVRSYHGQD